MLKQKKVLSLFSGCGGMDLGFEGGFKVHNKSVNKKIHPSWVESQQNNEWVVLPKTSFKTIFANDIFGAAQRCWNRNFKTDNENERKFYKESVVDLVKNAWAGDFEFPTIDVVTGGFPCQDFSLAGKRNGFKSHKDHNGDKISVIDAPSVETRGMLYYWMKNVIELTLPKVFVAENVKGLVSLGDTKKIIEQDFRDVGPGYHVVDAQILNAKNFGVAQNRERVIFIGFRSDLLMDEVKKIYTSGNVPDEYNPYPNQTHSCANGELNSLPLNPCTTVGDYILDLGEPEESNDLSHQTYSKAKYYGKNLQGNKEIVLNSISPTIRSEHHGNIEFRRLSAENGGAIKNEIERGLPERRLTIRECARIQTFPDNFEFVIKEDHSNKMYVSGSDAYKLIGNAVPPLLSYHIARRLEHLWPIIFKEE